MWLVLHANHAREFTPEARAAIRRIQARGIPVLGQSVLLRGVNDSAEALEALFRAMLAARVKPYYLHQLDPAPGTARFHVPIEEGRRLLAATARPGHRAGVADLRARHPRRARQGADRAAATWIPMIMCAIHPATVTRCLALPANLRRTARPSGRNLPGPATPV